MEDLKRMKTVSLKIHSVLKMFTFTLHYSNTILMHIAHVEKKYFLFEDVRRREDQPKLDACGEGMSKRRNALLRDPSKSDSRKFIEIANR